MSRKHEETEEPPPGLDAAPGHCRGHQPVPDLSFYTGPALLRPVAASHGQRRPAAGDRDPAVLPVREDFPARPVPEPMAPGCPVDPGAGFPGTGRPGGYHPWPRAHAAGMWHAVPDLPHGLGRGRHHRPFGRQPGRYGDVCRHDQCGGHLPHPAGDSAGEPFFHPRLLGLCRPYRPQGVPRADSARPGGLAHPLYDPPAAARPHALEFQFVLCMGHRPHAGHGALHPCAAAERPGRLEHRRHRPRLHGRLRRAVLLRPEDGERPRGQPHCRSGAGPEEHGLPDLAGL